MTHHLTLEVEPATLRHTLEYGLEWFISMLLIRIFEEMLLRGYPQWTLERGIGFWWAALLLSCAFGAMRRNNPGESPVGIFSATTIGLVFCLSIWYTRSLLWAIGFMPPGIGARRFSMALRTAVYLQQINFLFASPHGSILLSGGKTGPVFRLRPRPHPDVLSRDDLGRPSLKASKGSGKMREISQDPTPNFALIRCELAVQPKYR